MRFFQRDSAGPFIRAVLLLAIGLVPSSDAQAQGTQAGLAGLLPELILREITLPRPTD